MTSRHGVISIQAGNYRIHMYPEGGSSMEQRVPGIGWVLADSETYERFEGIVEVASERVALMRDVLGLM